MERDDVNLGDTALACASALVDALARGGVRHACLSPGSRSTALALALARHPSITLHVVLDERSSAFVALGIAKATGSPVAVACTSGTAAAELFPAVIEASQSKIPLVLLTADRPPRLRGTGANQTIDQTKLFGRYARVYVEVPVPASLADADPWERAGIVALGEALGDRPGPVHVNCPFEEPLTPRRPAPVVDTRRHARTHPRSPTSGSVREPDPQEVQAFAAEMLTSRGLVVVGGRTTPPLDVLTLAEALAWPVVAEPTSGVRLPGRALAAGMALLGSTDWFADHVPDVVLQVGSTPTTRAAQRLVASVKRLLVVEDLALDPDPEGKATLHSAATPDALARAIIGVLPTERDPASWSARWTEADTRARTAIDDLLEAWHEPTEGRAARDLAAAIPSASILIVGNSMPIRDLDYYMAPREGLRVIGNRGASGIDGLVSTTVGVAASGHPTYALLGDLTLLHDAGALLWSTRRGYDAVLVVVNNDGGAVFSFLDQQELPEHERLFTTPHGLDLGALCAAAGAGHAKLERASDLTPAVEKAAGAGGIQVVEVPSDTTRNRGRHLQVIEAVANALAPG